MVRLLSVKAALKGGPFTAPPGTSAGGEPPGWHLGL
jgi:hypothetical protein